MFAIVAAGAADKFVVVAAELERGFHLQIAQPPIAMAIVQIIATILQEDADIALGRLADQRGIDMTATNISEAAHMAEHFVKIVGPLPRRRKGADAAG